MATNKDNIGGNRTGVLDYSEMTITFVDKKGEGETVYDLKEFLKKYDGLDISISVTANVNAQTVGLEE